MKQIFEFIPLIAFFIAVKYYDIYVATGVIMAVSAVQIAVMLALKQEITKMQWSVTGLVLVMGTLTLVFHDERFIKWKPTDRKSTRLNSSHRNTSRMPSSA